MLFTDIENVCPIKSLIAFHWMKHDILNVIVIEIKIILLVKLTSESGEGRQ